MNANTLAVAMQNLPVRGIDGLKWMLRQHSGLIPLSCIRFLSTSWGGILGRSNATLTLRSCVRNSSCLRVI